MAQTQNGALKKDDNDNPVMGGTSSSDNATIINAAFDPVTRRLLTDSAIGSGSVTSVSVVSANGFAGTVATPTTTPAITLTTTITGVLKGNGTAISAAINSDLPAMTATVGGAVPTPPNNTTTFLRGDGTFATPSGGGTVTNTGGNLTANSIVLGAGVADVKVVAGILTDGTSVITLGVAGASVGALNFKNATSGTINLAPATGALGTSNLVLPIASDTLIGKATTDTLTNKTYDTAGAGNSFSINGVAVTANTGTGAVARAAGPTFTTPTLGAATATTINGNTFTTGTYTLTGQAGKTLTFNGSITLTGTDAQTYTFPTTTATIARTDALQTFTGVQTFSSAPVLSTNTLTGNGNLMTFPASAQTLVGRTDTVTITNKRITRRTATTNAPGATPTTNSDNVDYQVFTGLATAITSMTTNLSGTPVAGDFLEFWLTDNGTARAITWGASFASTTVTLPSTTVISTKLRVLFEWGGSTWDCVAVA